MPPSAWVSSPTMSTIRTTSQVGREQVGRGPDDVGQSRRPPSRGSVVHRRSPGRRRSRSLHAAATRVLEVRRHLGQVEVHPGLAAAPCCRRSPARRSRGTPRRRARAARSGCASARCAARPPARPRPRVPTGGSGSPSAGHQVEVVALAGADDAGLDARPRAARHGPAAGHRRRGRTRDRSSTIPCSGSAASTVASHSRRVGSASSQPVRPPVPVGSGLGAHGREPTVANRGALAHRLPAASLPASSGPWWDVTNATAPGRCDTRHHRVLYPRLRRDKTAGSQPHLWCGDARERLGQGAGADHAAARPRTSVSAGRAERLAVTPVSGCSPPVTPSARSGDPGSALVLPARSPTEGLACCRPWRRHRRPARPSTTT